MDIPIFTKEKLIQRFHEIEAMGWVENTLRTSNDGAAGNMLEDLLGIPENNLPIPNAAEWELKTHKDDTASLLTLFHQEPSPIACKVMANYLLPIFGWPHQEAGTRYPESERSFRTTLQAGRYTRGFTLLLDDVEQKVCVAFDPAQVKDGDQDWLRTVDYSKFDVTPYWGYNDLYCRAQTKLHNCFYVVAERKRQKRKNYFHFYKAIMLKNLQLSSFIEGIRQGAVQVDFDARTGHNHGTKFRVVPKDMPALYSERVVVMDKPKLG